jgi:diguanylate cyclase (GGDEF)-like protein
MSIAHDLTPLRWAPPPSGIGSSASDILWSAVRAPRAASGAFLLIRLTPAHGFGPPGAPELALRLFAIAKSLEGCEGVPEVTPLDGGTFLVFISGNLSAQDLRLLRDRVRGMLLHWALGGGNVVRADVSLPFTWSEHPERAEAKEDEAERAMTALLRLITDKEVRAVYQPVVSLYDGSIFGWEALCRGAVGTLLEAPDKLFACAAHAGLVAAVDELAHDAAFRDGRAIAGRGMLFLNVHPGAWEPGEEAVSAGMLVRSLARWGIPASRVVVEIAERHAAALTTLLKGLRAYREAGLRIAVDGAGAGYASLQIIAEVAPDFVKVDRTLVHEIDLSSNKRELLSVIAQFADRVGTRLIAGGIETVGDLRVLMDIGIGLGQGFLLARPESVPPSVAPEALAQIMTVSERRSRTRVGKNHTIQDLLVTAPTLRSEDQIRSIQDAFDALDGQDGLAVADAVGRPVGLLMKRDLLSRLAQPFGHELYQRKTVATVMDLEPLVVASTLSTEDVMHRILNRDQGKRDDHVIVTEQGRYVGVVPTRRILEKVMLQRMSQARHANPLTGLPGSIPVETEVNARLAAGEALSLLYVDLDNFKPYNDKYGVAHGDEVIASLARILKNVVDERHESSRDLLGHVGGDDFLLLTTPEAAVALAASIASRFDDSIPAFYEREDRERGFLNGQDRNGQPARFPLVSVSVAGVANVTLSLRDYVHATERLSALKGTLKRHPGSGYLVEGLGEALVSSNG